ncbi:MAG: DUF4153 domain-containing protein [Acidobacteriota bacterium]
MKLPSIHQVYLEAGKAVRRFPFVLLCAFTGVSAALFLIEFELSRSSGFPIMLTAILGIPLLTALTLFAEKRKLSYPLSMGIQLIGVFLLVGYAFTLPTSFEREPEAFFLRFLLLGAAMIMMVMILPYMKRGELNGFWHYNRTLFSRLVVTAVFSLVLFAGLAIALAALDNLFGVSIPGKRYGELWVVVAGLFAPWFFLSGVPDNLDNLDQIKDYPKGLKIFVQYILFSLVIIYLLILYSYLLKILLQWNWPKGWVSSLILGFSAVSILSLLLMYPIRDKSENSWIRKAGKWLYIVLIPLIGVLFLAVTERIGDYGITESRYLGIALGIWLSVQVIYFLFSRSKSIKFTIVSLCISAFLVSFGPWGMLSVSQHSQVKRLSGLMTKNGILINGRIHREHGKISLEDGSDITSIVRYLGQIHGYSAIRPWFSESLKKKTNSGTPVNLSVRDILDKINVNYVDRYFARAMMRFRIDPGKPVDISGYNILLRDQSHWNNIQEEFKSEMISYLISKDLAGITLTIGNKQTGEESITLDLGTFADRLLNKYQDAEYSIIRNMEPEDMSLEAEQNGNRVKLIFTELNLKHRKGKTEISSYRFDIAYTKGEKKY